MSIISFQNMDSPTTTFISAFALTQVLMESLNSRGANFIKNLTTEGTRVLQSDLFRSRILQTPAGDVHFDQI